MGDIVDDIHQPCIKLEVNLIEVGEMSNFWWETLNCAESMEFDTGPAEITPLIFVSFNRHKPFDVRIIILPDSFQVPEDQSECQEILVVTMMAGVEVGLHITQFMLW